MTSLPDTPTQKRLGLVIDLDICVGCHACAVSCKAWNTVHEAGALSDFSASGPEPWGVWLNRVHSYEVTDEAGQGCTVHFPQSCLHCVDAACVTVCPTGASYKRVEDGIVLVNAELCIGCKLCAWACPYGAREYDPGDGVMKKCTLCVDRIEDLDLPESERIPACVRACPTGARAFGDLGDADSAVSRSVAERGGYDLMPEMNFRPTNQYLPPRRQELAASVGGWPAEGKRPAEHAENIGQEEIADGLWRWVDRLLSR